MTHSEVKQIAEDAITTLISNLEQGHSDCLARYLTAMSRFHRYSWNNVLLISLQRATATHVAGFQTWHRFGRFVRKGEKGIVFLAPLIGKKKSEDDPESEEERLFGFRAAYVFDVSQTDGEPLPEFATVQGDPTEHTARLRAFVSEQGIALDYSDDIRPALGVSRGGAITLAYGLSPAQEFSTLAHELAHEKLHRTERRIETTKTIRETEAEAVAFVVCHAIGLDANTASSDYISLYDGNRDTLTASLDFIQSTATAILRAITPEDPLR
jgi:hypothetical protein